MTYAQLVADLQNYCQQEPDQPGTTAFSDMLPLIISNAQLRIYRELDFLSTRRTNASLAFAAGSRTLDLATMTDATDDPAYPVVVQGLSVIVPAGASATTGTRVVAYLVSLDLIDTLWPLESMTAVPAYGAFYFAMLDQDTIVVAPTPAAAYTAEVTGTWRPALMSATNTTTWLGDNIPDLLFAASMVEASGWMRDFGAMSDNPQLAVSWEAHYQALKASALEEEQRRKGQGPGWAPFSPSLAQPPRS